MSGAWHRLFVFGEPMPGSAAGVAVRLIALAAAVYGPVAIACAVLVRYTGEPEPTPAA